MSGFDLGFDLSAEAWDVCAPVWYRTSSGSRQHRGDAVAWTLSSKHSPAGVKKFGIINNRAFLFAVPARRLAAQLREQRPQQII